MGGKAVERRKSGQDIGYAEEVLPGTNNPIGMLLDKGVGSVSDLYFHRELCHAEATLDKEMVHGTRSRDLPLLSQ
jgi:hypothetical protein